MAEQRVLVGRVAGLFGVRGWVKIFSFTEPRTNILEYSPWYLSGGDGSSECTIAEGRVHGKGLIARIDGVADRDVAANYVGAEICVERDQFGPASADEHYWVDLEGMQVETTDGQVLGTVARLFATVLAQACVLRPAQDRRSARSTFSQFSSTPILHNSSLFPSSVPKCR